MRSSMMPTYHDIPKPDLRSVVKSTLFDIKKCSHDFYEPYKKAFEFTLCYFATTNSTTQLQKHYQLCFN